MLDSVRMRLTLWYTGVLALVLVIFAFAAYFFLARALSERTDASLAEITRAFMATFGAEQGDEKENATTGAAAAEVVREFRFTDRTFVVYDESRRIIASSDPPSMPQPGKSANGSLAASAQIPPSLLEDATRAGSAYVTLSGRGEGEDDGYRAFARLVSVSGRTYIVVVVRSLHDEEEVLERLRRAFYVAIPLSLLLASLGGYVLARKSLAPVVEMGTRRRGSARRICTSDCRSSTSVMNWVV